MTFNPSDVGSNPIGLIFSGFMKNFHNVYNDIARIKSTRTTYMLKCIFL